MMYSSDMKRVSTKKRTSKAAALKIQAQPVNYPQPGKSTAPLEIRDFAPAQSYYTPPEAMVRTQIYLTRTEHDFLMAESSIRTL